MGAAMGTSPGGLLATKSQLTRLVNVAKYEGVSLAELVKRSPKELKRLPGMGWKGIALAGQLARELHGDKALWFWDVGTGDAAGDGSAGADPAGLRDASGRAGEF